MQISSNMQRGENLPTFQAVNKVLIPRKVFKNPNNYAECGKLFSKTIDKAVGDKLTGKLGAVLAFFSTKFHKTYNQLENMSYANAKILLDKYMPDYSISWLAQNTGLPIQDVVDNEYHTFYVLTKEHKDGIMNCIKDSVKNMYTLLKEGFDKYPNDPIMQKVYAQAKMGVMCEENFTKKFADTQVKNFKLKNLDEVKTIVNELGV